MFESDKNKIYIFSIINAFIIFLNASIIYFAKKFPDLIENIYSRKIFIYINKPLSSISNLFDFSIGEIFIGFTIFLIILLFFYTIYTFFTKKWGKSILSILLIVFILLFNLSYYQLVWGLNNYRNSIEEIFSLEDVNITIEDIENSYRYLVKETNNLKRTLDKNNISYINDKYIYNNIYKGYKKINAEYEFINSSKVIVKPLFISSFFSASGYTGIYIPFFSESNINNMIPNFSKPFTASHEIAHQKGFSSEDDANFIGFLACYYNDNIYFKYSAYQSMLIYVGNSLYKNDPKLYNELASLRSEGVMKDIKARNSFWDKHLQERVNDAHNKVNDTFLKANNQPEGLVTYSRVTELFLKAHKAGLIH